MQQILKKKLRIFMMLIAGCKYKNQVTLGVLSSNKKGRFKISDARSLMNKGRKTQSTQNFEAFQKTP